MTNGHYRRRRAIQGLDWRTQLDQRSAVYRELHDRCDRLVSGLGGKDAISPQREALLRSTVVTWLLIDSIDRYLLEQPSIIIRRRKALLPIVRERNQLVTTFKSLLEALGLDRQLPPSPSLQQYLNAGSSHSSGEAKPTEEG
jgi:hypothetical protein